jgi:hypothetical protein
VHVALSRGLSRGLAHHWHVPFAYAVPLQAELLPKQVALLGPHTTPACANPSAGHEVELPVHVSCTSHGPAAARHTAPALPATLLQVTEVPAALHESTVQTLLSLQLTVVAVALQAPAPLQR